MCETPIPPFEYTRYTPADAEKGTTPVLFLHGFATRSDQLWGGTGWIRQYIRAGIPVLTVDLPFHGQKYLKDSNFTVHAKLPVGTIEEHGIFPVVQTTVSEDGSPQNGMALFADTLSALLDELAIQQVHGVGFSFGSRVGWELALRHPSRVASLILGGMPLHNHLEALRSMLSASCADDAITQDPATEEAFTSIIESSPLRTDALLDFVHIPFGEFFSLPSALADSTRIPVIHAANPPFPYPRVPLLIAIGSEDSIAADGRRLYPLLQRVHPYLKFLDIPGRDHVSALTSGVFRRNALAFAHDSQGSNRQAV